VPDSDTQRSIPPVLLRYFDHRLEVVELGCGRDFVAGGHYVSAAGVASRCSAASLWTIEHNIPNIITKPQDFIMMLLQLLSRLERAPWETTQTARRKARGGCVSHHDFASPPPGVAMSLAMSPSKYTVRVGKAMDSPISSTSRMMARLIRSLVSLWPGMSGATV